MATCGNNSTNKSNKICDPMLVTLSKLSTTVRLKTMNVKIKLEFKWGETYVYNVVAQQPYPTKINQANNNN